LADACHAKSPQAEGHPPTAGQVVATRILPILARWANIRPSGSSTGLTNEEDAVSSARTDSIRAPWPETARAGPSAGPAPAPARWTLLAATAGLAGAAALDASFGLLPSPPPPTAPLAALTRYAASHHHALLAAAWLEGTGTQLQVIFVMALAHLAGPRAGLARRITTVACTAVLGIGLVYDVMLIAAPSGVANGPQTTTAPVAYGLFAGVEHVFLIAPPLLPLGLILLRTSLLPRAFAWAAVLLGAMGPVLGLAGLLAVTANNNGTVGAAINALLPAQALWIAAASIITLAYRRPTSPALPQPLTSQPGRGTTLTGQLPVSRPVRAEGHLHVVSTGSTSGPHMGLVGCGCRRCR
jgi:hypothetical protein